MKFILSILCTSLITSFAFSQKGKLDEKVMQERLRLKNVALCECLKHCLPNGDSLTVADGSTSGYFEIGNYSIDVYPLIDSVAKVYSEKTLPSKEGKPLCFMKCLDFYNSKQLESFIIKLDPELNKAALKK